MTQTENEEDSMPHWTKMCRDILGKQYCEPGQTRPQDGKAKKKKQRQRTLKNESEERNQQQRGTRA